MPDWDSLNKKLLKEFQKIEEFEEKNQYYEALKMLDKNIDHITTIGDSIDNQIDKDALLVIRRDRRLHKRILQIKIQSEEFEKRLSELELRMDESEKEKLR